MLDSGAQHSMVKKDFVKHYKIPVIKTNFKYARMADNSKVLLKGETKPFKLEMKGVQNTIKGLVMDKLNYNIIAGMDCFTRINPRICWKTQTLTINQNGVNSNILKEPNNLILRDTIFVQVINTKDSDKLNQDSTMHLLC